VHHSTTFLPKPGAPGISPLQQRSTVTTRTRLPPYQLPVDFYVRNAHTRLNCMISIQLLRPSIHDYFPQSSDFFPQSGPNFLQPFLFSPIPSEFCALTRQNFPPRTNQPYDNSSTIISGSSRMNNLVSISLNPRIVPLSIFN